MFLEHEELISLHAAARLVPSSRTPGTSGIHVATIHRWSRKGIKGKRLETVLVGGVRYTSAAALARFVRSLNEGVPALLAPPAREQQRVKKTERLLNSARLRRQ